MTNPTRIRAIAKDGIIEVRMRMSHDMETGQRRSASGELIPAHFITSVTVRHKDRVVLAAEFSTSVSANPSLAFRFEGGAKGDELSVSWVDNRGEGRSDTVQIA